MKNIYIILLASGLISLFSCNDFLEVPPTFQENSATYFKNAEEINTGIIGCYDGLQRLYSSSSGSGIFVFSDLISDAGECITGVSPGWQAINNFQIYSSNALIEAFWNQSYQTIFRCNLILEKLEATEVDENLKLAFEGEVKFIRGLVYFNLVRIFGDVPIVTEVLGISDSYNYLREPVSDVYNLIIADFDFAKQNLPASRSGNEVGRATLDAVTGMLAKVYLTLKNFQKTRDLSKELMNTNRYELMTEYSSVFGLDLNKENIFDIHYAANVPTGEGSRFFQWFVPLAAIGGQGQGLCTPTEHFVNSYEIDDKRKDYTIKEFWPDAQIPESLGAFKYRDPDAGVSDGGNNWVVLRYADVLLMYAEAENKISYGNNNAFNALNMVRERAGLQPKTTIDLPNQESFDMAVEDERKIELAFEGHRWFDLLRRGRALEVMNNEYEHPFLVEPIDEQYLLFPIPLSFINTNTGITQNPGYTQ